MASLYSATRGEPSESSDGRTASAPYTKKRGGFSCGATWSGPVCPEHGGQFFKPRISVLLQDVVRLSLEALENFCVGSLDLAVTLEVGGRVEA